MEGSKMNIIDRVKGCRLVWINQRWNLYLHGDESVRSLVDEEFKYKEVPSTSSKGTYYIANQGGVYDFFFHNPEDESGSYGYVRTVELLDGTTRRVKGVWSSSAYSIRTAFGVELFDTSFNGIGTYISIVLLEQIAKKFGFNVCNTEKKYYKYEIELSAEHEGIVSKSGKRNQISYGDVGYSKCHVDLQF